MVVQDVASGATSGERTQLGAICRRWPAERPPVHRATLATPVARLATQQTVRWLEALIRTCPNGQLVSHRKYFEQEVSTRRQCKSDGSEGLNDVLHRAQHGRLLCQSLVLPGRNIGDGQARNELRWNSCRAHGPDRIFSDYT